MISDTTSASASICPDDARPADTSASPSPLDRQQIILKYLPLVAREVARLKRRIPSHVLADDLYSAGVTGLMDAAGKFDPATAVTFLRFVGMRIRGAMLDELRRMDPHSRRFRLRARELEEATIAVEQKIGRKASSDDICAFLGWSRETYLKSINATRRVVLCSLDQEILNGDGKASLHNLLADENEETGRDRLEQEEMIELLMQHIAELPEKPRKILAMYYSENLTLGEIAEALDLTESRIGQIHRQTIEHLRRWIKKARER